MKVTGVVILKATTPWSFSVMTETCALKAGGSCAAT